MQGRIIGASISIEFECYIFNLSSIFIEKASRCEVLQHRASTGFIGSFTPQCDGQGRFEKVQCWNAIGRCWCVDSDGRELEGTRAEGKQPDCSAGKFNSIVNLFFFLC